MLRFIIMFVFGMVYGAVLFLYGYNAAEKNFANELTNLIKRLPEDIQNIVINEMETQMKEAMED